MPAREKGSPNPERPVFAAFPIEMNDAPAHEDEGRAIIAYVEEGFVHQLHSSAYSRFQRNEKGVVRDGVRSTSSKGQRMITVHAIIKYGLLVTRDIEWFPIPEGRLKGRGREVPGHLRDAYGRAPVASEAPKRDYHAPIVEKQCSWVGSKWT